MIVFTIGFISGGLFLLALSFLGNKMNEIQQRKIEDNELLKTYKDNLNGNG